MAFVRHRLRPPRAAAESARLRPAAVVPGRHDAGMLAPEPAGLTGLLAQHITPVASLTRRLRTAALTAMPDLEERFLPGWRALALRHPDGGHLLGIFPRAHDVAVYFAHGVTLPDPHRLLTGTGRRTRMLVFAPEEPTPTDEQFVQYLDLALDQALQR